MAIDLPTFKPETHSVYMQDSNRVRDMVISLLDVGRILKAPLITISVNLASSHCQAIYNEVGFCVPSLIHPDEDGQSHVLKCNPVSIYESHRMVISKLAHLFTLAHMIVSSTCPGCHRTFTSTNSQGAILRQRNYIFSSYRTTKSTMIELRDTAAAMSVTFTPSEPSDDIRAELKSIWVRLKGEITANLLVTRETYRLEIHDSFLQAEPLMLDISNPGPMFAGNKEARRLECRSGAPLLKRNISILQQAGLTGLSQPHEWVPVSLNVRSTSIKGAFCVWAKSTPECQFISMNEHACLSTEQNYRNLYDCVNHVFLTNTYGSAENSRKLPVAGSILSEDVTSICLWPMFILNLKIPHYRSSTTFGQDGATLTFLAEQLLQSVTLKWLQSRGLRAGGKLKMEQMNKILREKAELSCVSSSRRPPQHKNSSGLSDTLSTHCGSGHIESTTPVHSIKTLVRQGRNRRQTTSSVSAVGSGTDSILLKFSGCNMNIDNTIRLSAKGSPATTVSYAQVRSPVFAHEWLKSLLSSWANDIFSKRKDPQRHLNVAISASNTQACGSSGAWLSQNSWRVTTMGRKLSKCQLLSALVIAQVDRKFILCKTFSNENPGKSGCQLLLLDQHAISERILYEELLRSLCSRTSDMTSDIIAVNTGAVAWFSSVRLERPLVIDITLADYELFSATADYLGVWGILYDVQRGDEAKCPFISVKGLPPVVTKQCITHPTLLTSVMRSTGSQTRDMQHVISRLLAKPALPFDSQRQREEEVEEEEGKEEERWLADIGYCPPGLIELIKSRACRSAVMFNDVLSPTQCQDLLKDLQACHFPFVCAHGRASAVPVVSLHDRCVSVSK